MRPAEGERKEGRRFRQSRLSGKEQAVSGELKEPGEKPWASYIRPLCLCGSLSRELFSPFISAFSYLLRKIALFWTFRAPSNALVGCSVCSALYRTCCIWPLPRHWIAFFISSVASHMLAYHSHSIHHNWILNECWISLRKVKLLEK